MDLTFIVLMGPGILLSCQFSEAGINGVLSDLGQAEVY